MPTGQLLATAIVILVTTPLQALGEEYGFRGYLMQASGSFFRSRIAALLITSGLFALAHGTQNFPLFFDRFAFGLIAGLIVILVGGLEAGIALHILNNLLAFGIAIAFNQLDSTLTVSEASWWQLPRDHRAERCLPAARAVGRPPDGAAQHDRSSRAGSRRPDGPGGRRTTRHVRPSTITPARLVGETGVCVSLTLGSPRRQYCQQSGPIPWGMG